MNRYIKPALLISAFLGAGYLYYTRFEMTARGKKFLTVHEGDMKLKAYPDIYGNATIGIGHYIQKGEEYLLNGITRPQGKKIFANDLVKAESAVRDSVKVPLKSYQRDALISMAFNIGAGNFKKSDLVRYINAGTDSKIKTGFMNWSSGGDLKDRRTDEFNLYSKGIYKA